MFLGSIEIARWYGECLTHGSSNRKLHITNLKSFCMSEKHRWAELHLSDVKFTFQYTNFKGCTRSRRHESECILFLTSRTFIFTSLGKNRSLKNKSICRRTK